MANKTLKDMFPDVALNDDTESQEASATKAASKAASELINILGENEKKDYRFNFRINKNKYLQFDAICKKKGTIPSAILQMYITEFIRENKNLLDE